MVQKPLNDSAVACAAAAAVAVIFDELQERGELTVADRRPVVPSRVDVHGIGTAELAAKLPRDLGSRQGWQALEQGRFPFQVSNEGVGVEVARIGRRLVDEDLLRLDLRGGVVL